MSATMQCRHLRLELRHHRARSEAAGFQYLHYQFLGPRAGVKAADPDLHFCRICRIVFSNRLMHHVPHMHWFEKGLAADKRVRTVRICARK